MEHMGKSLCEYNLLRAKGHSAQGKQEEKWCPSVATMMCCLSMVGMLLCLKSVRVI